MTDNTYMRERETLKHLTRKTDKMTTQSIGLQILNAIQTKIVEDCNERGINLNKEFESVDAFKNWVISFTIKSVQDVTGFSFQESFDLVMGSGKFEQLAKSIWTGARKKNA